MTSVLDKIDAEEIARAMEKGQATTGGHDGPSWVPMLAPVFNPDTKPEALAEKLAKRGAGSSWRREIAGTLVSAHAWGRPLYFLDVQAGDERVRVLLPENKSLYRGLDLCELGAKVAIKLEGRGEAKRGRKAPWRFLVVSLDKPALPEPAKGRPRALSMEEREAEAARRMNAGNGGDEHDDDLPF